jgi:uncharacterized protein (TIGR00661 family)
MAALAETSGPITRALNLAVKAEEKGHEVALCAAEDCNYHPVKNIKNYYAPVPSPFGLPLFIGKNIFKIAQILGIQQRKKVNSFEEVLHIVGAIDRKFFPKDVYYIRKAIRDFKPDVVYAEFRIAAIVAAKLENVSVVTGYSYPVQKSYASNPKYAKGVKKFLKKNKLPEIESVLDIFNWADLKFVASSYELEPIDDKKVIHVGPFYDFQKPKEMPTKRENIVAYMGNGTIPPKKLVKVLSEAFTRTNYNVYIASKMLKPFKKDNIHVGHRFDFNELLHGAMAFINHGGQNSIMAGLIYGAPQIMCPGNVFERQYNSLSIERLNAGVYVKVGDFTSEKIGQVVRKFEESSIYENNAKNIGERLVNLGGVSKVVSILEKRYSK